MYHTLQFLKPFGIAGFTASPLSEEFPYSRLLWEIPLSRICSKSDNRSIQVLISSMFGRLPFIFYLYRLQKQIQPIEDLLQGFPLV